MDDNRGTSLALLNTEKGEALFREIDAGMVCEPAELEASVEHNPSYRRSSSRKAYRDHFMKRLHKKPIIKLLDSYCSMRLLARIKRKMISITHRRSVCRLMKMKERDTNQNKTMEHTFIHSAMPEGRFIVTAGATYLDIDAYACAIAMAELLCLQGKNALPYSQAPCNYSVCPSLLEEGQLLRCLPSDDWSNSAHYIIVDVSDPAFLKDSVPLDRVVAIYDHHVGAEAFWSDRIGAASHIEFIGAAATLIYREWKQAGLLHVMTRHTALLLVAAILDNTLDLTSSNTAPADVEAFEALCKQADVGEQWRASYFAEVQACVEADLKNALLHDTKRIDSTILPPRIAQLCVWDVHSILTKLPQIRQWLDGEDAWMVNVIDIRHRCGYFLCDDPRCQKGLAEAFGVRFEAGIAKTPSPYLRKEIIKHIKDIRG